MKVKKSVKAFKQGDSTVMVIPASFSDYLEIGPGDFLSLSIVGKKLIVEKTAFSEPSKKPNIL